MCVVCLCGLSVSVASRGSRGAAGRAARAGGARRGAAVVSVSDTAQRAVTECRSIALLAGETHLFINQAAKRRVSRRSALRNYHPQILAA